MKICYLCADPGVPIFGRKGCSTHVRENCLTFCSLGHELLIVCANAEGDDGGREALKVVEIEPYRSKKLGFDLRHILTNRRFERAAARAIEAFKPDALYERYSLYSTAGINLAKRFSLPHLLEVNAFITWEQKTRIRLLPLARAIERTIFRRAGHIVVVSEPLVKEMIELRGDESGVTRLPMAVNVGRFSPEGDRDAPRRELGLDGKFVIGYVGTLTGWHGINLLHDLARRLKAMGLDDFAILVVGGDERRLGLHRAKAAEAGIANELRFIGAIPHAEVPRMIRAMDAAIVPDTTYWSSPAKLFEYQGCGAPVLAPRYPAVEMAMTHGEEGFIFEPRNMEELARLAKEMHDDPERRREMGRRGRERAVRLHSWEASAQAVIRILENQAAALGRSSASQGAS